MSLPYVVVIETHKVAQEALYTDSPVVAFRYRAQFEREKPGSTVWVEFNGEKIMAPPPDYG